jgi:hypothetical protein
MEGIDVTKSGNYTTQIKEELVFNVNWDKVKTFEDFILLAKHGVIKSNTLRDSELKNKDKDVKKFFKTDGSKVIVFEPETK